MPGRSELSETWEYRKAGSIKTQRPMTSSITPSLVATDQPLQAIRQGKVTAIYREKGNTANSEGDQLQQLPLIVTHSIVKNNQKN